MGYVREFLSMMSDDGGKENSKRETVPSTAIGLLCIRGRLSAGLRMGSFDCAPHAWLADECCG